MFRPHVCLNAIPRHAKTGPNIEMWAHTPGGRESPIVPLEADSVTLECVVPMSHIPGQRMSWISPTGQKVALLIPLQAEPGQTLEFDIPLSVLMEAPPDPFEGIPTAAIEIELPLGWVEGQKLLTQLNSGRKVVINPPPGALPGMSVEFLIPLHELEPLGASIPEEPGLISNGSQDVMPLRKHPPASEDSMFG